MHKITGALFYLSRHPASPFGAQPDYSHFPTDERLKPMVDSLIHIGKTPAFIVDALVVKQRFTAAKTALKKYWSKNIIAYSFKTNYAPIDSIRRLGGYAEVTSGRELKIALSHGYPGGHIVFNGPHKDESAVRTAWTKGALIQVDNVTELLSLDKLARSMRMPVRIGCRINLSGASSHFGMIPADIFHRNVLNLIKKHRYLRMEGIHFHIGTDIGNLSMFERSARVAGEIIIKLAKAGIPIDYINAGGGGISHGLKPFGKRVWKPYTFAEYVDALWEGMHKGHLSADKLIIYLEPGRYLIDDAVVFVSRVLRVKSEGVKQTLYIDGSTAMLPLSQYRPQIIRSYPSTAGRRKSTVTPTIVFGATCREDDILYRGWLDQVLPGDLLLFYCVGAYNQSLGSDFIFQKPETHILPF